MKRIYPVYKGLQKPIVFKGFRGKFIFWGIGALLSGLVAGALAMTFLSVWLGALVLAAVTGAGLLHVAARQKKGMYRKNHYRSIQIQRGSGFLMVSHGKKGV